MSDPLLDSGKTLHSAVQFPFRVKLGRCQELQVSAAFAFSGKADLDLIPHGFAKGAGSLQRLAEFYGALIPVLRGWAVAFVLRPAGFLEFGEHGSFFLNTVGRGLNQAAPRVPIILDYNCVSRTTAEAESHAKFADRCGADAVTIDPSGGPEASLPLLVRPDKGVFVVMYGGQGAARFQQITPGELLRWNLKGNCGIVVNETVQNNEAREARHLAGQDLPIFIPSTNGLGGIPASLVRAAQNSQGKEAIFATSIRTVVSSEEDGWLEKTRAAAQDFHAKIHDASVVE